MRLHVLVVLLVCSCMYTCVADTIELWNGKTADGVKIMGVKDGILSFKRGSRESTVKLTSIKNIVRANAGYRISYFADYELKRTKGRLLTINVTDPRPRISCPFVRVFCCLKNTKGAYELYLYKNDSRHDDPTRVEGLSLVDTDSYQQQHYFISRVGVAYRVEIWQDGELRVAQEECPDGEELPANWYKALHVKATRTFKELDTVETQAVEKVEKAEKEGPPATCLLRTVSLKPTPGSKDTTSVTVYYSLTAPGKDRVIIPDINFHYVAEDKDGNRDIGVLKADEKSGRETSLIDGRTSRTVSAVLPSSVGSSLLATTKGKVNKRVIHWLVEAKYGDLVIDTKEKNNPTVIRTLPKDWWKD